jgi:DNA gyrase subunit A
VDAGEHVTSVFPVLEEESDDSDSPEATSEDGGGEGSGESGPDTSGDASPDDAPGGPEDRNDG